MVCRREVLLGMGAIAAPGALLAQTSVEPFRTIPQSPSARVIVDNDFAGDPDGLAALVHQLLAPKTRVALITVSALNPQFSAGEMPANTSVARGRELALDLLARTGLRPVPVAGGAEDFSTGPSDAARAIVAEAMRDDPLPLFVTCGGPLTNVAAALRLKPAIAGRTTVIWIGGGPWPGGGWEYNLATDPAAARHLIEETRTPLWQVPQDVYRQLQYAIAEMTADMRPISDFTRWLYERFTDIPDFVELGGTWPMGDSPLVLLTALSGESSRYRERRALAIRDDLSYGEEIPGRDIRVYEQLDARLLFGDFLAQLRLHAAGSAEP